MDDSNVSVPKARADDGEKGPSSPKSTKANVSGKAQAKPSKDKSSSTILGRIKQAFRSTKTASRANKATSVARIGGTALAIVATATLCVAGGITVASLNTNTQVDQTVLWVDDDECVDYIQEAKEKLGYGENQIDETWNGHGVGIYATREFDLCSPRVGYHGLTSPYCFPTGSSQAVVQDAWVSAGAKHDDQGFCKIGDCYLIACTSVFGEVGDHITFYFDDGSSIDTVKIDAKSETVEWYDPTPATKWGHDDGRCVLEFCGQDRIGDNPYITLGKVGRHTVSWTNHGKGVDVGSALGGSVGGATSSSSAANQGIAASAIAECQAKQKYDNSTLAAALVSYSYSQRRLQDDSEMSTKLYEEICIATLGADDYCADYHFHSCDRGVAAAVRWTGADVNFPPGACDEQFTYCHESPLWEVVPGAENIVISGDEDWAEAHGLEPGDVGVSYGEHTLAYVGHDAVVEGYENFIKGNDGSQPGTGGDIGEPDASACWVSASAHQRGANIGTQGASDSRTYTFFRYTGDYPDKDKYADAGSAVTLSAKGANKNTACECAEEEEEGNCGEKIAKRALELSHSAVDDNVDYNALIAEAGLSDRYEYHDGNIYNIYPPIGDNHGSWGFNEPMDMALESVGINMQYERWQESLCMPEGYYCGGWYACCSPWPTGVLRELEYDDAMPVQCRQQEAYALAHPDRFKVIKFDPDKTWEEQCEPGDILNCEGHTALWVGNELAQKYFPGTTGNVCESGQNSRRNLGVTLYSGSPSGGWLESALGDGSYGCIIRVRCPDDMDEDGMLDDGPISAAQQRVIQAAHSTGSPGEGLCAMWISMVFSNAGLGYHGGNACDMYDMWCTSSNKSDLKPGMIVAVDTHPHTRAGSIYGHVGIYMGNGMVRDNIGEIRDISLNEWIDYYGATHTVKWGWVAGMSLA